LAAAFSGLGAKVEAMVSVLSRSVCLSFRVGGFVCVVSGWVVYVRDVRVDAGAADHDCGDVETTWAYGVVSARGSTCLGLLLSRWGGVVWRGWWVMLAVAGYVRIGSERLVEVGMEVDVVRG